MKPLLFFFCSIILIQFSYAQNLVVPGKKFEGFEAIFAQNVFQTQFRDTPNQINDKSVVRVDLYSMQGQRIKTINVSTNNQRISLADLNLSMCVVLAKTRDSYKSQIVFL